MSECKTCLAVQKIIILCICTYDTVHGATLLVDCTNNGLRKRISV